MPFVVVPFGGVRQYATFETLAEAEAAARAQSTQFAASLDGQEVRVLHALRPRRPGGRPRQDPENWKPLASYVDGRRIG
jgi:hypothetical protein